MFDSYKGTKNKNRKRDIVIKIIINSEREHPYKNLGVIGDCMWSWHQYFEERKKKNLALTKY